MEGINDILTSLVIDNLKNVTSKALASQGSSTVKQGPLDDQEESSSSSDCCDDCGGHIKGDDEIDISVSQDKETQSSQQSDGEVEIKTEEGSTKISSMEFEMTAAMIAVQKMGFATIPQTVLEVIAINMSKLADLTSIISVSMDEILKTETDNLYMSITSKRLKAINHLALSLNQVIDEYKPK